MFKCRRVNTGEWRKYYRKVGEYRGSLNLRAFRFPRSNYFSLRFWLHVEKNTWNDAPSEWQKTWERKCPFCIVFKRCLEYLWSTFSNKDFGITTNQKESTITYFVTWQMNWRRVRGNVAVATFERGTYETSREELTTRMQIFIYQAHYPVLNVLRNYPSQSKTCVH